MGIGFGGSFPRGKFQGTVEVSKLLDFSEKYVSDYNWQTHIFTEFLLYSREAFVFLHALEYIRIII